ncbi:MAG: ribosome small subunit-dependent GTPase A [Gemmatimonadetes bacterium]|nr:ribosome small subunit-dependent GTPase A [Gemmatimonadota bacterium]
MSRAGGTYRVYRDGEVLAASLRGRVKHGAEERVLVGDRVTLELHRDGSVTIEGVEDRKSLLRRRSPGKRRGVRAVAANVDQVVVVGSVREPQWDPYLVDRFLAVSEANQLPVLLVINKSDLAMGPAGSAGPADLAAPDEAAGEEVVRTSARTGEELDTLHRRLGGRASVFTGPTGVGKSSLLNALQPGLKLRTREVSARSGAGRHTTVTAEMHPFEPDGFVIDTPGLRDIGLWGLEPLDVVHAFPEIARLAPECRFDNCRHLGEPRCAVEAASARGAVVPSRLWSYRQLLREALEAARPWS